MIIFTEFYRDGNGAEAWQQALLHAVESGDKHIHFPAGDYHFFPEKCVRKMHFFCNNDEALRTIAVYVENIDGLTISGDAARWIFHGRISPLVAYNCRNLTLQGIVIDFVESFTTDADLVKCEEGRAWFRLGGKPLLQNGKIRFVDDFFNNFSGNLTFLAVDDGRGELDLRSPAVVVKNQDVVVKDALFGLPDKFSSLPSRAFVVRHEIRICPCIVIDACENVKVRQVTMHHSAGMGLLFQDSENLEAFQVNVLPNGRRVAVSDDAIHMVDCRGSLTIEQCELRATLDDSINVHGIYRPLRNRFPGDDFFYLDTGHFQQLGLRGARSGDTLELVKNDPHIPYARLKVREAVVINKAMTRIIFADPVPPEYRSGDTARIVEVAEAKVVVRDCFLAPLNGRGVLVSGVKQAEISRCRIHSGGAGVFVSGGVAFWYETGPVEAMVIKNNIFDNCNYKNNAATSEPVSVYPELGSMPENFFYHGTIEVIDNQFIAADRPLIAMRSVRKAVCRGNRVTRSELYAFELPQTVGYHFTDGNAEITAFQHCGEIECDLPKTIYP